MLKGIDVSTYQETIDWQKVKAAGIEFAFMKATEGGSFKDDKFKRNWAGAKSAGIPRGAYHFFRPKTSVSRQIFNFLSVVPELEKGDLPPVLDLEVPEDWAGLSIADRMNLVLTWTREIKDALKLDPILYMSSYFPDDVLGNDGRLDEFPLWVAHYTRGTRPRVPKPWQFYSFWQYTDSGSVAGVPGGVDMNRFNGSIEQLRKFMKQ